MIFMDTAIKLNDFTISSSLRTAMFAAICIIIFCTVGCDASTKQETPLLDKSKLQIVNASQKMRAAEETLRTNNFILLSMKYDVDLSKTRKIIEEYNSTIKKIKKESSPFRNSQEKQANDAGISSPEQLIALLGDLNVKYNIPKSKIASMLIDYKSMNDCKNADSE